MSLVVDASISAAFLLPDEQSEVAAAIGRRLAADGARAPDLFWHEMRNVLLTAVRRGRMDEDALYEQLSAVESLPIRTENADSREIARLSLKHRITAYDAAYLALAKFERLPLATLDKSLRAAASAEAVPLLPEQL
jgi:predicted nucleic acid-binding protein